MLLREAQIQKDTRFKIGDYKIMKKDDKFKGKNFEYFKKWIDGEDLEIDKNIYSIKETDLYTDGFYYFNDDIVFLKIYKNKDLVVAPDKFTNDTYRYTKYEVMLKINKRYMNKVIMNFRGMSIKAPTIKNAITSLINTALEEWNIEIDYEYAHILCVLAARYAAKLNQAINKEVEHNKKIYDEKVYEEEKGWQQRVKDQFDQAEYYGKMLVKTASSVVNSTHMNDIIESQKQDYSECGFLVRAKLFIFKIYMKIYLQYLAFKKDTIGLSTREQDFVENSDTIYKYIEHRSVYNWVGSALKTGQDVFNKCKNDLVKSGLETGCEFLKRQYWRMYNANFKISLVYIFLLLSIIPVCGILLYAIFSFVNAFTRIVAEDELWKFLTFQKLCFSSKLVFCFIMILLCAWNEHFNRGIEKHVMFLIFTLYGSFVWREFKLFMLFVKLHFLQGYRWQIVLFFIIILKSFEYVTSAYENVDYVQKIVYNPGTCTMNNVPEMLETLWLMYKDFEAYIKREKLTDRISHKFQIKDIRKPKDVHPEKQANKMPLVQKCFKIDGYYVDDNCPLKLHDCYFCEAEAVYRQVQSKIDYDDDVMEEFKTFAKKKLDELLDYPLGQVTGFDLKAYIQKLGIKSHEFEQGYLDYKTYSKIITTFKMHVKIDEKIYMNYGKYKMKARNISAQNKRVKLLMGIVCEIIMEIMHHQEWCGPGSTNDQKCKIFEKWIEEIGPDCGVVCADGSAFDSTQHSKIQEIVDNYAFEKTVKQLSFLNEFGDIRDFIKICNQQEYTIYSKYFTYTCKGTQMTGRMNTCLGNTMRSWLYVEFIKYKLKQEYPWVNIDNIREMVNGDDQIIFMKKQLFERYEQIAYKFVYAKEDISIKHGLGQIAKIFDKYPEINGAEFLSCILLYDQVHNKCLLVRKLERFLQLTPFTYTNTFTNINKFRYLNSQLMIADAQNILSTGNNLTIYKIYAYKMLEIGTYEANLFYKYICNNKKYQRSLKRKLDKLKEIAGHKSYISSSSQDRNNELDNFIFDFKYYEFLEKNYGITLDDIDELLNILNKITPDNYLEKYRCSIVDKLMKVNNHEQFLKVKEQIDKTKIDVSISLSGRRMEINQFHH